MLERFLVLHGHTPAGLSNQRMELEIKIALAHLARRTLVIANRLAIPVADAPQVESALIAANLDGLIDAAEPLLICTDSPSDQEYFRPLLDRYPAACFLGGILLRDWSSRLKELPFGRRVGTDHTINRRGAAFFAGTLFSRFTGYIHGQRLFERDERDFRYVSSPFSAADVPFERCAFTTLGCGFSWNQVNYPLSAGTHAWFREWPEARWQMP